MGDVEQMRSTLDARDQPPPHEDVHGKNKPPHESHWLDKAEIARTGWPVSH